MEYKKYYFKIASILICIETEFNIVIGEEIINFFFIPKIEDEINVDITFKFKKVKEKLELKGRLYHNDVLHIYEEEYGFVREFNPLSRKEPYAWLVPIRENYYEVLYIPKIENHFKSSKMIVDAINIEEILNKYNAFLLHSSFIDFNGNGILFTAPSGTGKSTQADLWNKYENTEIINGDRSAVRKVNGKWFAYGLPIAGSSGIYKNKKAELSHIIILKKGKENKLEKISPREAFIKLYSETAIYTWDNKFKENIIDMLTDIVQSIKIYQYECLPYKSAVEFLKQQIIKDKNKSKGD